MKAQILLRFALAIGSGLVAIAVVAAALAGVLSLADRVDAGDVLATVEAIGLCIAATLIVYVVLVTLERVSARLERRGRR